MTRTKKKTLVNISLEEAMSASEQFAQNAVKLAKVEAKLNEEINRAKSKYQDEITELKDAQEDHVEVLEVFAKEQQESWGKRKSMELLHCIIGFRTGTPKVTKDKKFSWDAVVELMKENKLFKKFIRTSEEINKEAILAEQDEAIINALKKECRVEVTQDESFYVEAKMEEIAA